MKKHPHLIILYGKATSSFHQKQQAMIEGRSVCGYRSYARQFGTIIYMAKQETVKPWDMSVGGDMDKLHRILKVYPDSIIWSVKHDPVKDRVLSQLKNKKVYYSCCANNTINPVCDVSLVDIPERVKGNGAVWTKGKDPNYWYPVRDVKLVDYLLIGKRGDKNEAYFINRLTREVRAERTVMWIGGEKHRGKIKDSHHRIILTPFKPMGDVRDLICTAKIGISLSELAVEGFPQTFLEMSMVGVPVLYSSKAPFNKTYFNHVNSKICGKDKAVAYAEKMLSEWTQERSRRCRQYAIKHYSLEKSYESILRAL